MQKPEGPLAAKTPQSCDLWFGPDIKLENASDIFLYQNHGLRYSTRDVEIAAKHDKPNVALIFITLITLIFIQ